MGRGALTDQAADFIRSRLRPTPLEALPEIELYTAHAASGLRNREGRAGAPPYWAYAWGGGLALARYLADHRQTVAGKRVLDLGSGSGLVAIAALRADARTAAASEIDPWGRAAIRLNAALNGLAVDLIAEDLLDGPAPWYDCVLVGDLFYNARLARRVATFLDRCKIASIDVLVGDPGRVHLPRNRLEHLADYPVGDFGSPAATGGVFRWA